MDNMRHAKTRRGLSGNTNTDSTACPPSRRARRDGVGGQASKGKKKNVNSGFTLLWSKILDSSVWMEDKETRLVWITMLAMKDWEGKVIASSKALAHRARVDPKECEKALKILLSPDPDSASQEFGGRRIREIPGGWFVLNHEKYRYATNEIQRQRWRQQKQRQRHKSTPLPGEKLYERTGETPHEFQ